MKIVINGSERDIREGATLAALLQEVGAPDRGVAVARNDAVVRRAAFAAEQLCEGDRIEIIRAVAGG